MLSMKFNGLKAVLKEFEKDKKQMRFAAAVALTRTAKRAAEAEKKLAAKQLDAPTPFTLRGFRFEKATKRNLTSRIYVLPIQSQYLAFQIEGGRRKKRSRMGEALPVNIKINKHGNIVGRGQGKIKKLLARPDVFIGRAGRNAGTWGIWQRLYTAKSGRTAAAGRSRKRNVESTGLKLLAKLVPSVQYKPRLEFYKMAERVFNNHFEKEFDKALAYARRTAR